MKKLIIVLVVVVLLGAGAYFVFRGGSSVNIPQSPAETGGVPSTGQTPGNEQAGGANGAQPSVSEQMSIGKSVEGRDILAYNYGSGNTQVLFVGGIHGGYEWNTVLVAYEAIDYFKANPAAIPAGVKVTVIPVLNPDGLNKVVGTAGRFAKADVPSSQSLQISGRFNANKVDLNRNFDCDWQANAMWRQTQVSGGSSAFSEPESVAFRNYIEANKPSAVVVWYSAANGVFASSCHNGVLAETNTLTNLFSKASGYPAYQEFNFYEITGDMVNWLAKSKIPAISILLATHEDTEWSKNQAGIKALLSHYAE
ncbi:MAG: M14 family zinc carboxypeptidase [Patescibacteria group bacterium]